MVTNENNHYLLKGNWIDIRDSGGKLYAKLNPDKRVLRIAGKKKHHYIDIILSDDGQFEFEKKT